MEKWSERLVDFEVTSSGRSQYASWGSESPLPRVPPLPAIRSQLSANAGGKPRGEPMSPLT